MEAVHILCFGDSLTEGYTKDGAKFHPYAESMTAALEKTLPNVKFRVHVEGVSGDRVCRPGTFLGRMEGRFKTGNYNWVIILGGTNDLNWGDSPSNIFTCLQQVQNIPLSHNAKILNMTVPETAMKNEDLNNRRDELNRSIREECDDKTIFLFDLKNKIPYHSLPADERARIWDDGVHFTPVGYDLMGEYLAERLVQLIATNETTPMAETQLQIPRNSNLTINIAFQTQEAIRISEEVWKDIRYANDQDFREKIRKDC